MAKTNRGGKIGAVTAGGGAGGGGGAATVGSGGARNANIFATAGGQIGTAGRRTTSFTASTRTAQDTPMDWANQTDSAMRILRAQMKQTGDEAGLPRRYMGDPRSTYIQTSKSYLINNALRNGMKSLTQGYMTAGAQNWINQGYKMSDAIKTIRSIDTGMKPLPKDMRFVRFESNDTTIKAFLGDNTRLTNSSLQRMTDAELNKVFAGRTRTSKTYVSTSWYMDKNSQRDRKYLSQPYSIEYTIKSGVHAVVTNNIGEHEALIGRGYDEVCTGARRTANGQIVFSVEITPKKRSGYYKV